MNLTRRMVTICVDACNAFLDWERSNLMAGTAEAKTQQQHHLTLKRLIRLARMLHGQAADPEYRDPTATAELDAVLWRLNESWQTVYNPMPEAEAEELLREHFPNRGS